MTRQTARNNVSAALMAGFLLLQVCGVSTSTAAAENDYEKITIIGETANKGVYDPALEYGRGGSTGWMVYSALEAPDNEKTLPFPVPKTITTHLAKSTDNGKTWKFIAELNQSAEATVTLNGIPVQGVWWNEVPTLVYDPDDPGKEWKLFWHKYFAIPRPYFKFPRQAQGNLIRVPQYMWIAYKCASSPEQLASAKEIILFGAGQFPLSPYKAQYNLNELSGWNEAKAYSEPGSLCHEGMLYLSLSGFTGPDFRDDRLLLFATPDDGKTWKYIGTLIDYNDASGLGYERLTGTSLVEENGRLFLLAAPVKIRNNNGVHLGTYVFEFDDITKARLKRDSKGKLLVYAYLKRSLPGALNSGQSDYDTHNAYGGIIMPQADLSTAPAYGQIFNTKKHIVNKPVDSYNKEKQ